MDILQRYFGAGDTSESAMAQNDNINQKIILCELIDNLNGTIRNDWSGETLSKEQAKKYIVEFGYNKDEIPKELSRLLSQNT